MVEGIDVFWSGMIDTTGWKQWSFLLAHDDDDAVLLSFKRQLENFIFHAGPCLQRENLYLFVSVR